MSTLHRRLAKAFPFVGTRAAREQDLFDYCTARDITVEFAPEIRRRVYVKRAGRDYIFMNSKLLGWSLLYVFCHEIAHQLLHVPTRGRLKGEDVSFDFDGFLCRRNHTEAEQAASLLLLPINELERSLLDGEIKTNEPLAELIAVRLDYYSKHGR